MTFTIRHRLWSQLWAPARPFVTPASWSCHPKPNLRFTIHSDTSRPAFSRTNRWSNRIRAKTRVAKSFASWGILLFDPVSTGTASNSIATIPTTSTGKSLFLPTSRTQSPLSSLAQKAWRRQMHSGARRRDRYTNRRNKSSVSNGENNSKVIKDRNGSPKDASQPQQSKGSPEPHSTISSISNKYFPHIPKMPHRPTKEELLAAATGFWSRLKVRFKWFSIRSVRPWNVDDWSAFVSWFMLGNIVWVLVGTTTFFSLVILSINTVVAQETLARWVGDYLTNSAGIKVVFESAIVPKWKDGVISFRNVFVSRRQAKEKQRSERVLP